MLLSLHGLPRTPGTPLTHRTLRTPLLLGLHGLPGAFRLKASADSSGSEPTGAVAPKCAGAFSASPLGPGRDGAQSWPKADTFRPQLPLSRASPLSSEGAGGSISFAMAAGLRAPPPPAYGPLALGQSGLIPGPAPERFKSALTEISFTLLRKGGAQDAKLY